MEAAAVHTSNIRLHRLALLDGSFIFLCRVWLANQIATFLVDTGCSTSVADEGFYRVNLQQNFKPTAQFRQINFHNPKKTWWRRLLRTHKAPAQQAIEKVPASLDAHTVLLPQMLVMDLSHFTAQFKTRLDGVLGMDALTRLNAMIAVNFDSMHVKTEAAA